MSPNAPDGISITPRRDSRVARILTVIFGCIAGMLVLLATILVLYPAFAPPHGEGSRPITCITNSKQLGNALRMYIADYDDMLPPAGKWQDASSPYVKNQSAYMCPSRTDVNPGYALNQRLDGLNAGKVPQPEQAPMLFESNRAQRNGSDQLVSFVTPHYDHVGYVGFLDGHVKSYSVHPSADAGLKGSKK